MSKDYELGPRLDEYTGPFPIRVLSATGGAIHVALEVYDSWIRPGRKGTKLLGMESDSKSAEHFRVILDPIEWE